MSYYKLLGLTREPFSTSPDPNFFHGTVDHRAALSRLQISVALRRGLSVMMGDVGTGKTTLSRRLACALAEDSKVHFRMILNPYFRTEKQFLSRLAALFHITINVRRPTSLDYMEAIEQFLFQKGVEEGQTIVLLIDEAQILPDFVFELLRILLNYETNEFKILQLVLAGQLELYPRLAAMTNFWDRIALKIMLKPLGAGEVNDMIVHRLGEAGYMGVAPLFTADAVARICEHTNGYPRRVNVCCHNVLEYLVMHDRKTADIIVVEQVIAREREADEFRHLLDVPPDPMALYGDEIEASDRSDLMSERDDESDDDRHGLRVVGE